MIPKFRAWLKSVGEMVEVLEIDFYNKEVAYIWTEQISDYELEQTREVDKLKDVTLMQYTGLKDKNGVEIYEGDIIEYNGNANDHGIPWGWEFTTSGKGVVKYDLAGYLVFDLHTDNLVKENLNEFLIQYEEIDVIVIGNIYENPELLKEQNK